MTSLHTTLDVMESTALVLTRPPVCCRTLQRGTPVISGRHALLFFFFNDPAPPEIYPLPLHDALPISGLCSPASGRSAGHPPPLCGWHGSDHRRPIASARNQPRPLCTTGEGNWRPRERSEPRLCSRTAPL